MDDKNQKSNNALKRFSKKHIKKIIVISIALILVVVIAVQSHVYQKLYDEKTILDYQLNELSAIETDANSKTTITTDTVVQMVNQIGELASIEYNYQTVGKFENTKEIGGLSIPFTQKDFLAVYDGRIKAGIDLNAIEIVVDNDNQVVTLNMPKAIFISHETFEDSFEIYDQNSSIFNPISPEDSNILKLEQKNELEDKLVEEGFLEAAQENGEKVIDLFLRQTIPEDYTIVYNYE